MTQRKLSLAAVLLFVMLQYGLAQASQEDDLKQYRKAADQGNPQAQFNLGVIYENGRGVPQDYAEAVRWYRKAAEQGFADAQENLGYMYSKGQGVPQDYAEAVHWYRKAAEQGDAVAQTSLAFMFGMGEGVLRIMRRRSLVPQSCRTRTCRGAIQPRRYVRERKRRSTGLRTSPSVVHLKIRNDTRPDRPER